MHRSLAIFNVSMWFRCDGKFRKFGGVWGSKHTPCCDAACSLRIGLEALCLEASDILPCINKGCIGEGTMQERLRSVGDPEDDDCISVAAHLFKWLASGGTNTGISDCTACTAIDAPMLTQSTLSLPAGPDWVNFGKKNKFSASHWISSLFMLAELKILCTYSFRVPDMHNDYCYIICPVFMVQP